MSTGQSPHYASVRCNVLINLVGTCHVLLCAVDSNRLEITIQWSSLPRIITPKLYFKIITILENTFVL